QAEVKLARASAQVGIEFISGSGSIDFQPYDDLDTPYPSYHLDRTTSNFGETAVFTGNPRPISRLVVTSPAGKTRLLKISEGPVPVQFCRDIAVFATRPMQNPEPVGDTLLTCYDAAQTPVPSTLRTNATMEVGLNLSAEMVIDFAADQLYVE